VQTLHLYADGSVYKQARKGGWGFILVSPSCMVASQGVTGELDTNCVELIAVIRALNRVIEPSCIIVYTDSLCVQLGIRRSKKPKRQINAYYNLLREHCERHQVTFIKVGKGRPDPIHKRAHHLAREAASHDLTTCSVFPVFGDDDVEVCDEAKPQLCG
jgi:ribonuclease HI